MHEEEKVENKEANNFNIRKLTDGTFVLSVGMEEYGYDNVDEMLSDLKDDLGGDSKDKEKDKESEEKTLKNKKKVKEIMGGEDEEDY